MTPAPQSEASTPTEVLHENKIVISGMSGLYPKSLYVRDLENILYNQINPISSDDIRWKYNYPEAAQYAGNVPDLDSFDAQFFKVHYRMGSNMDCMSRKMLEQAYEAIYDAGVNPKDLSNKNVGVYIGSCFSETEKSFFYDLNTISGLGVAGCNKSMFANRISYWLNAKGPSHSIDDACCSSSVALEQAYQAISRGECEAAIVGGANLCLHPQSSVHFGRLLNLSKDGTTKSFDQEASGCVKSEAINVLFLQKATDALRTYATVVNVQCEYVKLPTGETGPEYGFYRDPEDTARFLKSFYDRAGLQPNVVEYVEGFGAAMPEADKSELQVFDKIFCNNRDTPLMVGSVMSNIGYGEAASGISAITKVLLGYHRGELAGNLNCQTPRSDVAAIEEGRIQVLMDNQPFRRTYAAVNSMSVGGVNAHVLLHGNYKPKECDRYKSNIPHLVTISGRQDSSVQRAFDELKSAPIDPEQLALLHNIHRSKISGHLGRGYAILDTKDGKTVSVSEEVGYFDDAQRPLWFVYSGMGSQWAGMAAQLMQLSIFSAAIERCRKVLEPKGLDIVHIITSPDKKIFDNILHSFVGIAAVQIGLTDLLRELGLVPDKIIGHSVGELGCAYADGSLTAEETILSAYSRGLVSLETEFIKGSMAAIGLGFQEVSKLCPSEIEVACHNSAESCTISGPADVMQTCVSELISKGIFAKEVPCSNIAYHSRYIAKAGPALLKYLKEIIKTPKARSNKWVSTSVPQDRWDEETAKYSSAEYHTNNLLSPVLFEETSRLIPSNAVLVEIAPHGLLQAILKRSLPESCTNIPLTRRGHPDSPCMLLEAVGKLYMEGYYPKVKVLYPKIEFPVSTGTPFLSHLVDWAHSEKWSLSQFVPAQRVAATSCQFLVSLHSNEYTYLKGHTIKNRIQIPFSFALVAAWDTLAMTLSVPKKKLNVEFRELHFHAQPVIQDQQNIKLVVSLQRGSGWFEIMDGMSKVATGFIKRIVRPELKQYIKSSEINDYDLNSRDIYKLFFEKEYSYSGLFRSIYNANDTLTEANILWNDNWVTFIDGLLQLNAIQHPHSAISEPSHIRRMAINVEKHHQHITDENNVSLLKAHVSNVIDITRCGGVIIENLRFRKVPPSKEKHLDLKTLRFVPRFQSNIDAISSLQIFIQIVAENINKDFIKIVGIAHDIEEPTIFGKMRQITLVNIPGVTLEYRTINKNTMAQSFEKNIKDADIILIENLSNDDELKRILKHSPRNDVFIINKGAFNTNQTSETTGAYKIVSGLADESADSRLELIRFQQKLPATLTSVVVRSEEDLPSVTATRDQLLFSNSLIIISICPAFSGLKSLVKQWRKDSSRNNIILVVINNTEDIDRLACLPSDLAFNIIDNGTWGGEYYLPLNENLDKNDSQIILRSEIMSDPDSLKWVQTPALSKSGILVKVHYAGINMTDALRASGAIPTKDFDNVYGMEFSGVTESGERVMGLVPDGSVRSHVIAQPEFMWPVPSYWSLEDAATVPLAYLYAYYCLEVNQVKMMKTKFYTVLVHGGAGALGQAVISVCLSKGYKVLTTVSDLQKKKFLLRLFPELREEDIGYSRNASFGDVVLNATGGKGCHIVICCLKGELKNTSLKCCTNCGVTYDTAQIQNQGDFMFGMHFLTNDRSYTPVDITSIFHKPKAGEVKRLQMLLCEGIVSGAVRPLSRVTYAPQHAPRAFRLLAASRHRGRVLLRLEGQRAPAHARLSCSEEGCHVIFCDGEPLGLQLADLLISSGAKNIHLHFAQQPPSHLRYKQSIWCRDDVQVSIYSEDLSNEHGFLSLLQKVMTKGPVDGVYWAANIFNHTTLPTLDLTVRKLCPSMKNFLVFSNGDDLGQSIAIRRARDGLPATEVNLSMLEAVHDEDGSTWYPGIKEAVEQALLSSHTVLLTQTSHRPRMPLLQQISALADLTITEKDDKKTTLEDLGIQMEKSQVISTFMRDELGIAMDEVDIPSLSLESIQQIEGRFVTREFEDTKGLGTFYSFVDSDEMKATTEFVLMATLTSTSNLRDDEFESNETFMCVVPGLEGQYKRFSSLCEQLKLPALVLQPGLDYLHETVEELALRYSKVVLTRSGVNKHFYILGYEAGVPVALELAAILEKHGQTGTVFCIGDGPDEIKSLIKEHLREYSDEEALQTGLIAHMFRLMTGAAAGCVQHAAGTWRQRVDACVRTLLGHVPHSAQYARTLIEAAYARIMTTINHTATPKPLNSNIVLLRALSSASASTLPSSLQRYSRHPISVYNLTTPLAHAVNDLQCPAIINKHLSKQLLDAFDTKNLCESYLLNANTFMIHTDKSF